MELPPQAVMVAGRSSKGLFYGTKNA